jgi:hypothetical protein
VYLVLNPRFIDATEDHHPKQQQHPLFLLSNEVGWLVGKWHKSNVRNSFPSIERLAFIRLSQN